MNSPAGYNPDIQLSLYITPEEASNGCQKQAAYTAMRTCQVCDGWGTEDGNTARVCPKCNGIGSVNGKLATKKCHNCGGLGLITDMPCHQCGGKGIQNKAVSLNITIPENTRSGQVLRCARQGNKPSLHRYTGVPGDLLITVTVGAQGGSGYNAGDLENIVNTVFGQSGFGQERSIWVTLNSKEAQKTCSKLVHYKYQQQCSACSGIGGEADPYKICPACGGTGNVVSQQNSVFGTIQRSAPCKDCHGHGYAIKIPCSACKGKGRKEKKKTIEITIPAGSNSLKLEGYGDYHTKTHSYGPLLVNIRIK